MWSLVRRAVKPVQRDVFRPTANGISVLHPAHSITRRRVHDTGTKYAWTAPTGHATGVRVLNSLTAQLVPLTTREAHVLHWYTCGPTVYDHAHLGHARNYVTVDILHRVLKEFFRLEVHHVLGMTDIDDKILTRARDLQVSPVQLARQFEREFFADMRALHVQPPSVVTRVSEHVPEIRQFVEQISQNGYAFKSPTSDSVYFDVTAFQGQHYYGKLKPELNLVPESDPDLAASQHAHEKRGPRDFALWKAQDGGRPGWHIECVAMSHAILGRHFDVHSGGIDLKFPHHNNEVAIADAYLSQGCNHESEWVNYFMHIGHLNIKGLKMSKSLKNFVTIKEYLSQYGANEFRLFCLMSPYYSTLDYTEQRVVDARQVFKRFDEFFSSVEHVIRRADQAEHVTHRWHAEEHALHAALSATQSSVRSALSDNVNTSQALTALLALTARTAQYLHATERGPVLLLVLVRDYVSRMLTMFGLQGYDHVTASASQSRGREEFTQLLDLFVHARQELRTELLHALKAPRESTEPRDAVVQARDLVARLMPLVDRMRDQLQPLGIKLEDSKGTTLIKEVHTDARTEASLQQMRAKSRQRTEELREAEPKRTP